MKLRGALLGLVAGLALLAPHLALGQGAQVYQNGGMVPNHPAKFVTQGRIADGGGLLGDDKGVGLSPFGVTDNNALGLCLNNAATLGSYKSLCFGHDSTGNPIFSIDSTTYPFVGAGSGSVVGPSTSTSNNASCWNSTNGKLLKDCDTGAMNGLILHNPHNALKNLNGDSLGWNTNFSGYTWETSIGTASVPFNQVGPSVKISRTEEYTDPAWGPCNGIQNNVDCNSGLQVVVSSAPNNQQQSQAIVGVGNLYTNGIKDNRDIAGVFGLARALGSTGNKAFAFAGYAEAVAPLSWAVGAEITIWNATGTDAVENVTDNYGHNGWVVDCGAGILPSNSCNNAFFTIYVGNQFHNGYVVGPASATTNAFYDVSDAFNSITVRGLHYFQFNGEDFAVTGTHGTAGKVGVFIGPAPADPSMLNRRLAVWSADNNQGYFASVGATPVTVALDIPAGGGQIAQLQFQDVSNPLWSVGKGATNEFFIIYNPTSSVVLSTLAGAVKLGKQQNVSIDPTTGAMTVGQMAGVGNRHACIDAAGKLYAGTTTVC